MCWSKRSEDDDSTLTATTTRRPMDDKIKCPANTKQCDPGNEAFCSNNGICCERKLIDNTGTEKSCVCYTGYNGKYCQNKQKIIDSREELERAQTIVIFSAILGTLVIAFLIAIIVLQIKYYRRRRKKSSHDHELNQIARPDAPEREKEERKRLRIQPGYSWRESVRGHSKKLGGASSRSVPDDLSTVGLKPQFTKRGESGKKPNLTQVSCPSKETGEGKKAQSGASEGSCPLVPSVDLKNSSVSQKHETVDGEDGAAAAAAASGPSGAVQLKMPEDTVK